MPDKDIQRKLAVAPELFLIGTVDGQIVGTAMAGYDGHRGWVNYLAVAPEHQRRGCATQLVGEAEALLGHWVVRRSTSRSAPPTAARWRSTSASGSERTTC